MSARAMVSRLVVYMRPVVNSDWNLWTHPGQTNKGANRFFGTQGTKWTEN